VFYPTWLWIYLLMFFLVNRHHLPAMGEDYAACASGTLVDRGDILRHKDGPFFDLEVRKRRSEFARKCTWMMKFRSTSEECLDYTLSTLIRAKNNFREV
jgi:hypothetical protein